MDRTRLKRGLRNALQLCCHVVTNLSYQCLYLSNCTLPSLAQHKSTVNKLGIIGTLSSYDGNAKEDVDLKMNTYFQLEFREWLDVLNISYGAVS